MSRTQPNSDTCKFCGTVATPRDEQNCTSLEQAYEQTPQRPYGCPWFDKESRKMHPRPQRTSPESEVFTLIDARLADLREANEVFRKTSWDRSSDIHRNDREIRWLADLRSMLVLRGHAQSSREPTEAEINCARFVRWAMQEGPWQGGDLDGASVQEKAEELGLIVSVPYDPEKHGAYNDYGCDAGDPWFEFSPGLNAIRTVSHTSTDRPMERPKVYDSQGREVYQSAPTSTDRGGE